ncbi:MAG: lactoylglutathione lyase [Ruminococcus sp.]|nr:lactoylglutathione lyase [Ruminococcus sp.]
MKFTFAHNNLNVYDLQKSLDFYKEALGLTVERTTDASDGSFTIAFLGDQTTPHLLELTWLRDMDRPYELGDNEIHLAFKVDDFDAALAKHKEMGCVCFENPEMGIYFIEDPDGYWLEIIPAK